MAYTSPSGSGTTLKLTLTGEGANPTSMPCSSDGTNANTSTNTTSSLTTPDTGFFTSEDSSATPFVISGAIILTLGVLAALAIIISRSKRRLTFAKNFRVKNIKLTLKHTSLLAGLALIVFIALGAILPNTLQQSDSASALETTNALAITTGSSTNKNTLSMSSVLSSSPNMAIASETVSVTTATTKGYTLYLSTNDNNKNSLYRNNDPCGGYIKPTAGTTTKRTSLEINHWGFAVDINTDTALKNTANWAAVPKYGNEVIVKQKSTATSANDSTRIIYGTNTNNTIPAGEYSNTIIYTAIANV